MKSLKLLLIAGAFAGLASGPGVAQVLPDLPESQFSIDELRAPTSPAFTILNVAPTNVVRPNTPRQLALEILSATERSSGDLPSNLALEIAPYWLFDRPKLTFEDYYNPDGIGQTIARSLSLSLATTDIPDPGVEGTSVGLGLRFHLVSGKPAPGLEEKVDALQELQLDLLDCVPDISDEEGESAASTDEETAEESPAQVCEIIDGELVVNDAELLAKLRRAGDAIRNADRERSGWVVEAALAAAADYPDNTTTDGKLMNVGAWVTASYHIRDPDSLTFLAVGRYLQDRRSGDKIDMYDLGGRLIWRADQLRLALSLEAVHRTIEKGKNSTSVLGVLEFPINDTFGITASYGKGLATPMTEADIVATLSINLGFGKGPVLTLPGLED